MSDKTSHREILKSTSIIGGSSVVVLFMTIVRTKVLSGLLGTDGYGIFGQFSTLVLLMVAVSGLGIGNSGVRQIAEAVGKDDSSRITKTVVTLRRVALFTGLFGTVLMVALAFPLSRLQFKTGAYGWAIMFLSLSVLFTAVYNGQVALINGMRRIRDLASLAMIGGLASILISIPLVWALKTRGIAPSLVAVSLVMLAASWWYARRIKVDSSEVGWGEIWTEGKPLLILGFAFMVSAVLTYGSTWTVGVLILRLLGKPALSEYSAAYMLAFTYPSVILAAMARDFYPRLTVASKDIARSTRLVNEQLEVGVLLAAPGVMAVLALAPVVIRVQYHADFLGAVPILEWQILGFFLQVMSWALGYILLARADSRVFLWTELVSNLLYVGFVFGAVRVFGVVGAGIGYFMEYAFHWVLIYWIVKRRHGFRYTRHNILLCLILLPLIGVVFVAVRLLPSPWGMVFGVVATGISLAYTFSQLTRLLGEAPHRVALRVLRRLAPRRQRGSA